MWLTGRQSKSNDLPTVSLIFSRQRAVFKHTRTLQINRRSVKNLSNGKGKQKMSLNPKVVRFLLVNNGVNKRKSGSFGSEPASVCRVLSGSKHNDHLNTSKTMLQQNVTKSRACWPLTIAGGAPPVARGPRPCCSHDKAEFDALQKRRFEFHP